MKIIKPSDYVPEERIIFKSKDLFVVEDYEEFQSNKYIVAKAENVPIYYYYFGNVTPVYNEVLKIDSGKVNEFILVGVGSYVFPVSELVIVRQDKVSKIPSETTTTIFLIMKVFTLKFSNVFKKLYNYLLLIDNRSFITKVCDYFVLARVIKDRKGKKVNIIIPKTVNKFQKLIIFGKGDPLQPY